jgi:hypothetical protein
MQYNIKKKIFEIGTPTKKTTLSLTGTMHDALTFISEQTNQSIPEVIVEALEQYLTHLANEGVIPFPKAHKEKKIS